MGAKFGRIMAISLFFSLNLSLILAGVVRAEEDVSCFKVTGTGNTLYMTWKLEGHVRVDLDLDMKPIMAVFEKAERVITEGRYKCYLFTPDYPIQMAPYCEEIDNFDRILYKKKVVFNRIWNPQNNNTENNNNKNNNKESESKEDILRVIPVPENASFISAGSRFLGQLVLHLDDNRLLELQNAFDPESVRLAAGFFETYFDMIGDGFGALLAERRLSGMLVNTTQLDEDLLPAMMREMEGIIEYDRFYDSPDEIRIGNDRVMRVRIRAPFYSREILNEAPWMTSCDEFDASEEEGSPDSYSLRRMRLMKKSIIGQIGDVGSIIGFISYWLAYCWMRSERYNVPNFGVGRGLCRQG